MDASLGMDDDEFLIRQVEAVEASFGLNSQTAEGVQGSKDKDSGAAVDGVNPASGNMLQQEKQKSCALGKVVENGSKKRAHVKAAEDAICGVNLDNMHQQNCTLQENEKTVSEENKRDHLGKENEDEDDEDYDDNEDEYEDEDDDDAEDEDEDESDGGNEDKDDRDEDDDFDGCPPKGGRGGRSGRNGYEQSVVTKVRGQGSGRGQESRATGGSSSGKQCCNMRHYEDNTNNLRDFVCTSRIVDFSYTKDSDICGSVDVVNVTPPKDRNQQNHDDDSVDRRFTKSSSETVRCALTFATGNTDVGNVVLVTTPQRNEKRSHVIEDDDEYFDPTLTDATQVHGGGVTKTGTLSCPHNDETPSGESDHIVLVTPQKQYNKHNLVIEADDEFMLGLPCRHAIATASFRNIEYALFVSQYHVKDTWSETVKGIILPVPNPEDINIPADILKVNLYPPKTKRTKGRPGIKRKLGASDYAEGPRKKKKPNKCSRCFKEDHKKTTCKEPVP
ncbi:BnaC01g29690D [Brassica napus]|uniref:BnaC01g29690D protein n=1 Tax=Brassica napus TaxID=3708 RepID=A0A078GFQ3_BRANA|nr:BnaC01g29690D [Brassica napus]